LINWRLHQAVIADLKFNGVTGMTHNKKAPLLALNFRLHTRMLNHDAA